MLLALVLILPACGGGTKEKAVSTRVVQGPGFSFSVPAAWKTRRTRAAVVAERDRSRVSSTVFPLLKPYDPSRFGAAAKELDRIAGTLASRAGGTLTEKQTTTVDGRRIRAYRYEGGGKHTRIGFVLVGKREFQLLCDAPGSADIDGACALLFATFKTG